VVDAIEAVLDVIAGVGSRQREYPDVSQGDVLEQGSIRDAMRGSDSGGWPVFGSLGVSHFFTYLLPELGHCRATARFPHQIVHYA
jgi:hypothetical protein